MTSDIRVLGKHTLVYGAGIALSRLASFIMLPIYTRFLTPADYGNLELLTLTVDFVGTVAGVGLAAAVFKFYSDASSEEQKREVVGTAEISLVSLAAASCVVGILASAPLSDLVLGADGRAAFFRLFFLIYLFQTAETIPLLYLRARNLSKQFVAVTVGRLLIALALNVYFVVILRLGLMGVLYSSLITGALFASVLTAYLFAQTGWRFSRRWFGELVRFGAPMVLWFLGNFVLVFSDRFFLKQYADSSAVGVYSLAYRFGMLISAFGFRPFNLVWGPQRFEIIKKLRGDETIRRVFGYLNVMLGFVAVLVGLFSETVIEVMADQAFHAAAGLVMPLVIAQILYHLVTFPNLSMLVTERTEVLGRLAVVSAIVVLALNAWLIPRYGPWGAAIATLTAYAVRFVIVYAVAQRIRRLPYGWGFVTKAYFLFAATLGVRAVIPVQTIVADLALGIALAGACALLTWVWILERRERAVAWAWITDRMMRRRPQRRS